MTETRASQFVRRLAALAEEGKRDRAALATLKRSLAFQPGTYVPSFALVEPWVSEEGWQRTAYYLVAGLLALDPRVGSMSLPEGMALVYRKRDSRSIESRFLALLDADRDQLPDRLRRCVHLVLAEESPGLDWASLLSDLLAWFHPDRVVQRRWARTFYRALQGSEQGRDSEESRDDKGEQP